MPHQPPTAHRSPRPHSSRLGPVLVFALLFAVAAAVLGSSTTPAAAVPPAGGWSAQAADGGSGGASGTDEELTVVKAVVLGLVEGITEFLPISSTGHLVVAQRLMDLGTTEESRTALDAYTVIIQLGAILAVLLVSWRRVVDVALGLVGRSETGRRLLVNLILGFAPFAVVGALFGDLAKEWLLDPGPVAAAWIIGGVLILVLRPRFAEAHSQGVGLDAITRSHALVIGVAQVFALWPGVSRSFIVIVGGLLVGLSMRAAVEFSFLLGLVTLGAATVVELISHGGDVKDAYGLLTPAIGLAVAGVSAFVAVKWMVGYLQKRDLNVFGWYRIAIGVVTFVLIAATVL